MISIRNVFVFSMLGLGACTVQDSNTAHTAQKNLVGATAAEIDACAGTPDHLEQLGPRQEFRTYSHDASSSGGFSLTLPVIGGVSLNGGGYCRATFRMVDGHVTELRYAGDKDGTFTSDSTCAPLIKACVKQIDDIRRQTAARSDLGMAPSTKYSGF